MKRRAAKRGVKRFALAALKFTVIAGAFTAVLLASGYFTVRMAFLGREVKVPDVTGMTLAEAQDSLRRVDLFVQAATDRHDDRLEQGRILAQEPAAGADLKKNRTVKVVTSLGPRVFKVPDVRGRSLRAARIDVRNEGLNLGEVAYAHTLLADADVVVSQEPEPSGENLGEGGVALLVSKGPRGAVFVMPDLVGRRIDEIRPALEARGLRIGSVRRERDSRSAAGGRNERGAVTRQYPESGFPVSPGDVISLAVSD